MLGNSQDAKFITEWARGCPDGSNRRFYGGPMPEGWKFIGYGSFRSVYLSPEGVAYKVQQYYSQYSWDNVGEYQNWQRIHRECEFPEGVRLPDLTLYENGGKPVVAMEYVRGMTLADFNRSCQGDEQDKYRRYRGLMVECGYGFNLLDMHEENVMVDEESGDLVVIDIQM